MTEGKTALSVLVTGGAGFIGSNLTEALLKKDHRVRVLDNFSTGKQQNLVLTEPTLLSKSSMETFVISQPVKQPRREWIMFFTKPPSPRSSDPWKIR